MVTFVVLRIVVVVLLVAANAFFVAAEFALVSVRETRLQQMIAAHRIGARTVQKLHQKLDNVLNAVQFGVTVPAWPWAGSAKPPSRTSWNRCSCLCRTRGSTLMASPWCWPSC